MSRNIGQTIRNLRKEKRLTQTDLAKGVHVTQQTVTAWESGRAIPNAVTLDSLANLFNVSTDYLVGRSDLKNPEVRDFSSVMSFDGEPLDEHDKKLLADIYRSIKANRN